MSEYKLDFINIMKMLTHRVIIPFCCFLGLVSFILTGCKNNVDCQAPPPSFFFKVIHDGSIYPDPADTSAKVMISYLDGSMQKSITDLKETEGFFASSEIIMRSWDLNNPEFTLKLNDQVLATIKLDTYMNNGKCQGWASISNVYENGETVPRSDNGFYLLGNK